MYAKTRRPPAQGLLIRLGGVCGLIFGFANGVIRPVDKAMNCSADGTCAPREETVGVTDIFVPMGLGVLAGMAIGLLLALVLGHLARTL